jgi:TP53 regulating kinase-like protein
VEIIRRGAEAEIRRGSWMGRDVISKSRVPKGYRHPQLDASLRLSRTRNEARLLQEARKLGIPTPIVYDIDIVAGEIIMQEVKGPRIKDLLDSSEPEQRNDICREIGRLIALLHDGGMTHGDLTTSNMIFSEGRIWFIDFSLGGKNATVEDMGVDLHLLKEAFQSTHSEMLECFQEILDSYQRCFAKSGDVLRKIKNIEDRGRYT